MYLTTPIHHSTDSITEKVPNMYYIVKICGKNVKSVKFVKCVKSAKCVKRPIYGKAAKCVKCVKSVKCVKGQYVAKL